jgi:hypothetical protein
MVPLVAVALAFAAYCAVLLVRYLPVFLSLVPAGPESVLHLLSGQSVRGALPFILRDIGMIALGVAAWRAFAWPLALSLIGGLASFAALAFVFQANYICVALLIGVLLFSSRDRFSAGAGWAFVGLLLGLPAALADPSGHLTGFLWAACLGLATLFAIIRAVHGTSGGWMPPRVPALAGSLLVAIGVLVFIGVGRGQILADSGFNSGTATFTPAVRDIWDAVRERTPPGSLVFTDQVGKGTGLLEGWNTFAFRGQRQIFVSNYVQSLELRTDPARLDSVLAANEAVLNGADPRSVKTRRVYQDFFAVVSRSRLPPSTWDRVYANDRYALYRIGGRS